MRNSGMIYRKDFKMSSMNYAMRLIGMLPEQHVPELHQFQYLSICSQNECAYMGTPLFLFQVSLEQWNETERSKLGYYGF